MKEFWEFLKKTAIWVWRIIEFIAEFIGYVIVLIFDLWFIAIIAIFIFIAWYLGLIK